MASLLLAMLLALVSTVPYALAQQSVPDEVEHASSQPPAPEQQTTLESEDIDPEDIGMDNLEEDALPSWIDKQHAAASNRAQALAQWTDSFFGAQVQDAERADTFLRVIVSDQWDRRDGHDFKLRLRGQVNLPAISERVDLVFSGAETEAEAEVNDESFSEQAGLRVNVTNKRKARLDATISASSGPALVPGVRFRYQDDLTDNTWYRFTQRYQYDTERGNRFISDLGLNRFMGEGALLRWNGRARYRADKGFWDWRSAIIFRQWFEDHERFPSAAEYFVRWGGSDDPELRTANFTFGARFRRQWLRPFLYYEIEPNIALRQDEVEEKRKWYPGLTLRLEVMLDDDLIR